VDQTRECRECEPATDDLPLRQGDVFAWLTRAEVGPFRQFGVIVTADCDIAQEKHRGIISYVPVMPLADYLRQFDLPRRVERALGSVGEELVAAVRGVQAKIPEFPEPMSQEAVLGWVEGVTATAILSALAVREPQEIARLTGLIADYQALRASARDGSFDAQLDALASLRARNNKGPLAEAQLRLRSEIADATEKLPGDAFFVGYLADGEALGHVAYLRLVREIRHDQIATRVTDLASAKAKRVSRMSSPYLYRLTQQLADVFAAIGLPDVYERQRRLIARSMTTPASKRECEEGKPK